MFRALAFVESQARFNTIGAVRDTMCNDGVEQLVVNRRPNCGAVLGFARDQRLEGFERLDGALVAHP